MCGITGIFNRNGQSVDEKLLRSMTGALAHRGPDGEGFFLDGPIGFGHRRLAIIDLTETGKQPMSSGEGDFWITYNGELYNFLELKAELESKGHAFSSTCDTEVILYAYKEWGVDCVKRFNGMFAFALWDKEKEQLFLARDRFGVKPLYLYQDEERLLFASEIKGILKHSAVNVALDTKALKEYFTFQNILSERTLFEGISLLESGTSMLIDKERVITEKYWTYDFTEEKMTKQEALDALNQTFGAAVTRQLMSDVGVSSFLSSGMDSTSIATVASSEVGSINTYSCGFDMTGVDGFEKGFDERSLARITAERLGTTHQELEVSAKDMQQVFPKLIYHLEDLRMGMSFPNYLISQMAAKENKVILAGTGGDELFAGYPWRYYYAIGDDEDYTDNYYAYWTRLVADVDELFAERIVTETKAYSTKEVFRKQFASENVRLDDNTARINNALAFEAKTFLHGLFIVEDKVSMAHSLETRVPFMDNDLVDLAMRIPLRYKLQNYNELVSLDKPVRKYIDSKEGKLILREAMEGLIPHEVAFNKKQGFSAPVAEWFRKQSRGYVEELLLSERFFARGIFNRAFVEARIRKHMAGEENNRLLLWSLLCFEHWCRIWLNEEKTLSSNL